MYVDLMMILLLFGGVRGGPGNELNCWLFGCGLRGGPGKLLFGGGGTKPGWPWGGPGNRFDIVFFFLKEQLFILNLQAYSSVHTS